MCSKCTATSGALPIFLVSIINTNIFRIFPGHRRALHLQNQWYWYCYVNWISFPPMSLKIKWSVCNVRVHSNWKNVESIETFFEILKIIRRMARRKRAEWQSSRRGKMYLIRLFYFCHDYCSLPIVKSTQSP